MGVDDLGWRLLVCATCLGIGFALPGLIRRAQRWRRNAMWGEIDRRAEERSATGGGHPRLFKVESPDHGDNVGSSVEFEVTDEIIQACRTLDVDRLRSLLPLAPDVRDETDFAVTAMHLLRASGAPVFSTEEAKLSRRWLDQHDKAVRLHRRKEEHDGRTR